MTAIGLMVGAEISGGMEKHVPTLGIVGHLLKRIEWHGLNLSIDIGTLDRQSLYKVYKEKAEREYNIPNIPDALALVSNPWWTLVTTTVDPPQVPLWWAAPTQLVVCHSRTVQTANLRFLFAATPHACLGTRQYSSVHGAIDARGNCHRPLGHVKKTKGHGGSVAPTDDTRRIRPAER